MARAGFKSIGRGTSQVAASLNPDIAYDPAIDARINPEVRNRMTVRTCRSILSIVMATAGAMISGACGGAAEVSGPSPTQAPSARDDSGGASAAASIPTVLLAPAFPKLTFQRPVFLTHAGDGSNRVFVVEQAGRILVFENRSDIEQAEVFLDIQPKVRKRH